MDTAEVDLTFLFAEFLFLLPVNFLWVLENNFVFYKLWRAIQDVLGRRLSEAKPAEEGGCTPLVTAKL